VILQVSDVKIVTCFEAKLFFTKVLLDVLLDDRLEISNLYKWRIRGKKNNEYAAIKIYILGYSDKGLNSDGHSSIFDFARSLIDDRPYL
jgi:hypothetical protein